jgi:hypothetical protein
MKKLLLLFLCVPLITFGQTWTNTFGGTAHDRGRSIQQTTDGGYIITGRTSSFGNGVNMHSDVYLIKTDVNGVEQWNQTFDLYQGGDEGYSVQQTTDGGYIITGCVTDMNVLLIKTDGNGNLQWTNNFGGLSTDQGRSVQQTTDGGYIITGYSLSATPSNNGPYVYLIKTDVNGVEQWNQTFGPYWSFGMSVQETSDGGYIITGYTGGFVGIGYQFYLIKTDGTGNIQWNNNFGGILDEHSFSVQQTTDGGYIIVGNRNTFGMLDHDVYLVKTDSIGVEQWSQTYGGTGSDRGSSVQQTTDGGYVITGETSSFGNGGYDVYLVKTDGNGVEQWTKTFGGADDDRGNSVQQTTDGGYIITGYIGATGSGGAAGFGSENVYVIKTDSNGCINTSSSQTETVCDSYVWNGATYTSSGTYTWNGTNAIGCDSTVILILNINNSTTNIDIDTVCDSYTWSVNGVTYTSSVVDTVIGVNASGCTETNILNLTINSSTTSTTTTTECDSYTWSVNGVTYTSSVVDTVIGVNSAGCIEINILNLIINNTSTSSVFGNTLVSYLSTETYNVAQTIGSVFNWHLINGGIIINGQNTNSIEVQWGSIPGTYVLYVIETDNIGCIGDTVFLSVNVSNSTNVEDLNIDKLTIYPNPSQDVFNVEFTSLVRQDLELRIINSIGEIVYIDNVNNHIGAYSNSISLEEYSTAIYFLEIQTDDGIVNKKLILQ